MLNVNNTQFSFGKPSLEEAFKEHHIREVDVCDDCEFDRFLMPNEPCPQMIESHLAKSKIRGLLVSVFKECNYATNEKQFSKIKRYADAGNIISTIGNICSLSFLDGKSIAVVDMSNIRDYTPSGIYIEGGGPDFDALIIETSLGQRNPYNSYFFWDSFFEAG
jgi:hypothetical protein